MGCSVCRNLEEAYEAAFCEYVEARSSAGYRMSTKLAGQKNVEMERARYELEEHRTMCVSTVRQPVLLQPALLPQREMPASLRPMAA
ncbi:MAG: hypothetical protein ABSD44_13445 [Terracidiphilus sp.]